MDTTDADLLLALLEHLKAIGVLEAATATRTADQIHIRHPGKEIANGSARNPAAARNGTHNL